MCPLECISSLDSNYIDLDNLGAVLSLAGRCTSPSVTQGWVCVDFCLLNIPVDMAGGRLVCSKLTSAKRMIVQELIKGMVEQVRLLWVVRGMCKFRISLPLLMQTRPPLPAAHNIVFHDVLV